MTDESWEHHAQWWIEGFTDGADPEYDEQILPMAAAELSGFGRVLDVGCGEGQVSRLIGSLDATPLVVGIDPTWNCVSVAVERSSGPLYSRADAAGLPFADESFDAVIACLVFEHIDALDDAIAEVSRVLRPGGRFAFFLNHPILQAPGSAWVHDHMDDPPDQYWRLGPYLVEASTVEQVEKDVSIRFVHRPISRYVNTLAEHDLVIERMIEPSPPPGFLARSDSYVAAAAFPRLLYYRLRKSH